MTDRLRDTSYLNLNAFLLKVFRYKLIDVRSYSFRVIEMNMVRSRNSDHVKLWISSVDIQSLIDHLITLIIRTIRRL